MSFLGIRWKIFPEESYFRKVDCGYIERDKENLIKYRYAVQKYVKDFVVKNPNVSTNDLTFMKYKAIFYALPVPLGFFALKSTTGKTGWITCLGTFLNAVFWTRHYFYNHNLYYQTFLMKNYHLFEPNMQKALVTGDHRYLRHLIDSKMTQSQLFWNSDIRLLFK